MPDDIFGNLATRVISHIVPLRGSGVGPPLFCFPGSGGNIHVFRDMIAAMPEGPPVYGVNLEWLCDERNGFTVEQIAAFYQPIIQTNQNKGPYSFCGYSFGGLVAYELARRLTDDGYDVSLVALLDAPNPALLSNLSAANSAHFRSAYVSDRIRKYARFLSSGNIKAFFGRGLAFISSRAGKWLMPSIKVAFRLLNRPLPVTFRANDPGFLQAWLNYIPKQYPNGVVCFRTQDRGPEHDLDPSMGWDACAKGGVRVLVVPGGHVDMMRTPSVHIISKEIMVCLRSECFS
jgi:thioesterase domain-containing protein